MSPFTRLKVSCALGTIALALTQTAHAATRYYDTEALSTDSFQGVLRYGNRKPIGVRRRSMNRQYNEAAFAADRYRPVPERRQRPVAREVYRYSEYLTNRRPPPTAREPVTRGIRSRSEGTIRRYEIPHNRRTLQLLNRLVGGGYR